VVNLAVAIVLMGMDELPFKLIREVVLVEAVIDVLFWAAMTVGDRRVRQHALLGVSGADHPQCGQPACGLDPDRAQSVVMRLFSGGRI